MKNRILTTLIMIALAAGMQAEIIVLKTGARIRGTVVFENEEVVIFRDAEGARYQYPRAEVAEVVSETEETSAAEEETNPVVQSDKKASILLELGGGPAFIPNDTVGGAFSADLLVGSHVLGGRHLFVGAGLGYHGMFLGAENFNLLPIQIAVRMPMMEQKHAPMFGVAVGYGIALSKMYLGGLYAGLDLGYRCQLNPKTAIALVAFGQFQQAFIPVTEVLDGEAYTARAGRSLVTTGIKLSLFF